MPGATFVTNVSCMRKVLARKAVSGREEDMAKIIQLVGFKVDREFFGVPIGMVKEIVRLPEITPVPDTPEFVEGVINLRGKIVPVIDMRKRLGAASIDYGRASRVLILELGGKIVGLIVDSASEILKISEEAVEPPPELVSSIGGDYITGVGKLNDKLIVMLDLTKLMSVEEIKRFDSMKKLRQGEDKALEEGGKALGEGNK